EARKEGIPDDWIEATQQSPIYKMIIDWKIALPLQPEYRTMPMVWKIPPLSPIMNTVEGVGSTNVTDDIIAASGPVRSPIEYLANLLTAGDETHIRTALKKMAVMRSYMRSLQTNKQPNEQLLTEAGLTAKQVEEMYRLLAIAKYQDRFVIPSSHKEDVSNLYM